VNNFQSEIRITKFLLHETGSYNQQYRRPYNTELSGGTLGVMAERLDGATSYEPSLLGGIANQFIKPAATPEKQIVMANGWNERRMRFMMEIEQNWITGGKSTEVVLGYTNYVGVLASGVIDPQMEFYVNSTTQIRSNVEFTPMGTQVYNSVSDSSHILADNNWSGIFTPQKEQRMRPEDVYSTMSRQGLYTGLGAGSIYDSRSISTTSAVKSRRSNASAANYMAQVLQGYSNASQSREFGDSQEKLFTKARGDVAESLVSTDGFLSAIGQIRGTGIGNVFTYNNLLALDPQVELVTRAQLMMPVVQATAHQAGQTAEWGGADIFTTTATVLSNAIPSIMMDLTVTRLVFKTTNRNFGGAITTVVFDAQGFSSGDLTRQLEVFKIRLEQELLRDISFNNAIDFAIEMRVDLLGETWISLSLDGKAPVDYVTPSFCDALMVPVLTCSDTLTTTIASDFEALSISLADLSSQNHKYGPVGGWKASGI